MSENWRYYNHAIIPTGGPHEEVTLPKRPWKDFGRGVLFARWTTDFDCQKETNWWYVIKDTPFDLSDVDSGYRYKIRKGAKLFDVRRIDPFEYKDQLIEVEIAAFSSWPEKYRPSVEREPYFEKMKKWSQDPQIIVYGAFYRETEELCGYIVAPTYEKWAELQSQRVKPSFEKYQINAALVYGYLCDVNDRLGKDFYICDGARSIRHETAFQDYLEKYFRFRKAYCRLQIHYRPIARLAINIIYPFRKKINKDTSIGSMVAGMLTMEEIRRDAL